MNKSGKKPSPSNSTQYANTSVNNQTALPPKTESRAATQSHRTKNKKSNDDRIPKHHMLCREAYLSSSFYPMFR